MTLKTSWFDALLQQHIAVCSLVTMAVTPFMLKLTFLLKITTPQTTRANKSYPKAGSIVYTAISSMRSIFSLHAVESMIAKFTNATEEAYDRGVSQVAVVGVANGLSMGSFLLAYIPVTLYGPIFLSLFMGRTCCTILYAVKAATHPVRWMTFECKLVITLGAEARAACSEAIATIKRTEMDKSQKSAEKDEVSPIHRGYTFLPEYVIDSSSPKGLKPEMVKGNLEFQNVWFAYPTRKDVNVFDGFLLSLDSGKTVALVGQR